MAAADSSDAARQSSVQAMAKGIKRLHHSHDNIWLLFHNTTTRAVLMLMSQDDLEQQAHQLKRHQVHLPQPLHEYVWLVHSRYWDPVDLILQGRPDLLNRDFSRPPEESVIKEMQQELLMAELDLQAAYKPAKACVASLPFKEQSSARGKDYMWLLTCSTSHLERIIALLKCYLAEYEKTSYHSQAPLPPGQSGLDV